jgi:hypothetical protein
MSNYRITKEYTKNIERNIKKGGHIKR